MCNRAIHAAFTNKAAYQHHQQNELSVWDAIHRDKLKRVVYYQSKAYKRFLETTRQVIRALKAHYQVTSPQQKRRHQASIQAEITADQQAQNQALSKQKRKPKKKHL